MSKVFDYALELEAQGKYDEALSYFEMVMDEKGCPFDIRKDMGRVLCKKAEYKEARSCFDLVLTMDETHLECLFGNGLCYMGLNDLARAYDYFAKAVALDETNANYWYYLALVSYEIVYTVENPDFIEKDLEVIGSFWQNFRKYDNPDFIKERQCYKFGIIYDEIENRLNQREKSINVQGFYDELRSYGKSQAEAVNILRTVPCDNLYDEMEEYKAASFEENEEKIVVNFFRKKGVKDNAILRLFDLKTFDELKESVISDSDKNPFPEFDPEIKVPFYADEISDTILVKEPEKQKYHVENIYDDEPQGETVPEAVNESVPTAQAVVEEPVSDEPAVVEEPVTEEPVAEPQVVEEPVTEEPVSDGPQVVEEPVTEEPVSDGPQVVEEPVTEEPVSDGPQVVEEPVTEEPVAESVSDEPTVVEEPVTEEPVAESVSDEPTVVEEPSSEVTDDSSDVPDLGIKSRKCITAKPKKPKRRAVTNDNVDTQPPAADAGSQEAPSENQPASGGDTGDKRPSGAGNRDYVGGEPSERPPSGAGNKDYVGGEPSTKRPSGAGVGNKDYVGGEPSTKRPSGAGVGNKDYVGGKPTKKPKPPVIEDEPVRNPNRTPLQLDYLREFISQQNINTSRPNRIFGVSYANLVEYVISPNRYRPPNNRRLYAKANKATRYYQKAMANTTIDTRLAYLKKAYKECPNEYAFKINLEFILATHLGFSSRWDDKLEALKYFDHLKQYYDKFDNQLAFIFNFANLYYDLTFSDMKYVDLALKYYRLILDVYKNEDIEYLIKTLKFDRANYGN